MRGAGRQVETPHFSDAVNVRSAELLRCTVDSAHSAPVDHKVAAVHPCPPPRTHQCWRKPSVTCVWRSQVVVISLFFPEHQGAGNGEDTKGNAQGAGLGAAGADEQGGSASADGDSDGAGLAGGEHTHAFSGGQNPAEEEHGAEKGAKGIWQDEHEEEEEDRKREEEEERLRLQDEQNRLREEEEAARFTEMAKAIML